VPQQTVSVPPGRSCAPLFPELLDESTCDVSNFDIIYLLHLLSRGDMPGNLVRSLISKEWVSEMISVPIELGNQAQIQRPLVAGQGGSLTHEQEEFR
jgi:hypothetical protein